MANKKEDKSKLTGREITERLNQVYAGQPDDPLPEKLKAKALSWLTREDVFGASANDSGA